MKKYKTINFLEKNKSESKNSKSHKICLVLFIVCLSRYMFLSLKEVQILKAYIEENASKNIDVIEVMSYEDPYVIQINNIQEIYNSVGKNNITSFVVNNSNLEIEGKCLDLNLLDNIKNYEFIKNMSINKIKREGDAYIFNVSYELIDK